MKTNTLFGSLERRGGEGRLWRVENIEKISKIFHIF